jgi:hypothetical protein
VLQLKLNVLHQGLENSSRGSKNTCWGQQNRRRGHNLPNLQELGLGPSLLTIHFAGASYKCQSADHLRIVSRYDCSIASMEASMLHKNNEIKKLKYEIVQNEVNMNNSVKWKLF